LRVIDLYKNRFSEYLFFRIIFLEPLIAAPPVGEAMKSIEEIARNSFN
jgi:hypothetical protein